MATMKREITLEHRPNTGEALQQVHFAAGAKVDVLAEWTEHYLCKDAQGRLFNVPREALDLS